jgi:hypothetical protein
MGPIRYPETSVKDYRSTLRDTPEERRCSYYNTTNPLPTFRVSVSVPSSTVNKSFLTFEDETDTLSRNVGKGLPLDAA